MIDRINLILKAKNITARQFAEEIGIQPSGMSHIMSGRNRPSLDFVMKVINRYPEIDIKWLTLGEGQMYAPSMTAVPASSPRTVSSGASSASSSAAWRVPPVQTPMTTSQAPMSQELDLFSTVETPAEKQEVPSMNNASEMPVADLFTASTTPAQAAPSVQTAEVVRTEQESIRPESVAVETEELSKTPKTQLNENRTDAIAPAAVSENQNLKKKKIVKVVVLYDDHSFSEYYPE